MNLNCAGEDRRVDASARQCVEKVIERLGVGGQGPPVSGYFLHARSAALQAVAQQLIRGPVTLHQHARLMHGYVGYRGEDGFRGKGRGSPDVDANLTCMELSDGL